jgi:hypothetical protein
VVLKRFPNFPCNLRPNFRLYMPTTIQPQQRKEEQ